MRNLQEVQTKKLSISYIIANQHPVTICWLVASLFLICSMYLYTAIST